jgi:hypothetical protein
MRQDLMELALMQTTIGRVVQVLEPLTEIGQLRRMSDAEVRAAAKTILEQRSTRISSRPQAAGAPTETATTVPQPQDAD